MDSKEPDATATPTELDSLNKKNYREKCYDTKYLKKRIPFFVNLTKNDDCNNVRKGLIGLKTILLSKSDSENILNILHLCGGLKHLVKLLNSTSDQRQLGMVLCILHLTWNKIAQSSLRVEILNNGAVGYLGDILVKSSDANNVMRALKFLSILSQHQGTRELNTVIAKSIVNLLSLDQPSNIQITAIKTLRQMWSAEKSHGKLLECGAVRAVAMFLDTKDSMLFSCILKALVIFTDPCTISASQQVSGKGDGYQLIVAKVGKPIVCKLICNLSRSPVGRIELTRAGLVPEIIRQISSRKHDKYLIMALCQMCQESMVRASLRLTPCGFETFLSLITNRTADQYHSDLLYALTYFIYDTQSLSMMVKSGLVDVLIEKLRDVATTMGNVHEETPPSVLSSPESPTYSPVSPALCASPCENFFFPSPESSIYCCNKKRKNEVDVSCSKSQDSCILKVLLQLTYHHTKLKTLALRYTIDTILKYMTTIDFSKQESNLFRATKTLQTIVNCKHHFNNLLEEKTIMSIHRELCVRRHWNCMYCDKLYISGQRILTEMAGSSESALGEGEMAHRLTSGTSVMKTTVALTIPFIIKQPKLLCSLLLLHRGLDCLIKALDSHIDDAVPALHLLMKTVGVSNPQVESMECCEEEEEREEIKQEVELNGESIMFELDDGSIIQANKERLVHNYPMFEAMFRGGFKEASAETIKLPDITSSCFEALVKIDSPDPSESALPKSVATLLEMVCASDRFLSPTLAENLISHIVHRVLSSETSPEIYSWSANTGFKLPCSSSLSITTISYLFTADMFLKDRVKAVSCIINSAEKQNLFCDLNSIILAGMQDYNEKFNRHTRHLAWNAFNLDSPPYS